MEGITLRPDETLRVVVTIAGREEQLSLLPFFSKYNNSDGWWYMEPRRFCYLYEHLWEVNPYKEAWWSQEQIDDYNKGFAETQEYAWREVYHRLFHYVQTKVGFLREGSPLCWSDLDTEKHCRIVTETVLKHFPPSHYKLPELPYAQEYRSTWYRVGDMIEAGWPLDSAIAHLKDALARKKDWSQKDIKAYLKRAEEIYKTTKR